MSRTTEITLLQLKECLTVLEGVLHHHGGALSKILSTARNTPTMGPPIPDNDPRPSKRPAKPKTEAVWLERSNWQAYHYLAAVYWAQSHLGTNDWRSQLSLSHLATVEGVIKAWEQDIAPRLNNTGPAVQHGIAGVAVTCEAFPSSNEHAAPASDIALGLNASSPAVQHGIGGVAVTSEAAPSRSEHEAPASDVTPRLNNTGPAVQHGIGGLAAEAAPSRSQHTVHASEAAQLPMLPHKRRPRDALAVDFSEKVAEDLARDVRTILDLSVQLCNDERFESLPPDIQRRIEDMAESRLDAATVRQIQARLKELEYLVQEGIQLDGEGVMGDFTRRGLSQFQTTYLDTAKAYAEMNGEPQPHLTWSNVWKVLLIEKGGDTDICKAPRGQREANMTRLIELVRGMDGSQQLVCLQELDDEFFGGGVLQKGDSRKSAVTWLQACLVLLGYMPYSSWQTGVGTYGNATGAAVLLFQNNQHIRIDGVLRCDGVFGPATYDKLKTRLQELGYWDHAVLQGQQLERGSVLERQDSEMGSVLESQDGEMGSADRSWALPRIDPLTETTAMQALGISTSSEEYVLVSAQSAQSPISQS